MPRSIRFHLDEHVDPAVAAGLRRRGVDVTTTAEAGLIGKNDTEQLAFALTHGRVFFTSDQDFLQLHAAGTEHAGIIYCHPQAASVGAVVHGLFLIAELLEAQEMRQRVEYLATPRN